MTNGNMKMFARTPITRRKPATTGDTMMPRDNSGLSRDMLSCIYKKNATQENNK